MNKLSALLLGGASCVVVAACNSDPSGTKPLTACATSTATNQLQMPVGAVRVFASPKAADCLTIPAGASASDYVFVVSNANSTLDDEQKFTFQTEAAGALASSSGNLVTVGALTAAGASAQSDPVDGGLAASADRERALRLYERQRLDPAASLLATGSAATVPAGARGALVAGAIPTVGQTMQFRVPGDTTPCDKFATVNAVVRYISNKAIIVQDVNAPANGFTDVDFAQIAGEFDNLIYSADVSYFGNPGDIDQNGRVYILFTPEINKLTPRNSTGIFAGFFFAGDLYPRTGTGSCNESNLAEIFYLLVPDATGQYSRATTRDDVRELTRGTVAHEFQHMINAGQRFPKKLAFEDVWLDEGLAHFAEEAVGRVSRGFGDTQELSFNDVVAVAGDYDAFFVQNLRRFRSWLLHPDTSSGTSKHADENLSSRGAAWAIVRYASEKYSGGDVRAFTRALTAGPEVGLSNLTKRAGVPFDSILVGFTVASFADDTTIAGLDPRYTYATWRMRDAVRGASGLTNYPLLVTPVFQSGSSLQSESRTGAATYFRLGTSGATPVAARVLNGSASQVASFAGARLYVLRVK